MSVLKKTGSVSARAKKQPKGHYNKYYGMYVGFIKENVDLQKNGRLRVWVKEFGGTENDPQCWITVSYCSPFAGATPLSQGEGFDNTQTSYGMWMVPPDKDVKVAVMFANGDISTGFWFGCIYDQYMNNMVPAIASSTQNQNYGDKSVPVAEYNKNNNTNYSDPVRPVHEPSFNATADQGLINDDIRGTTTSSARRDALSQVYGIATPGPKNPNSKNRLGGSRLIMDDGEGSEYIGLKTRGGNFLKLDETNGLIYLINKAGTAWVQLDAYGNVDVFSAGSISMRSREDVNIRADRNINFEAGKDIHIKASKDYTDTDYVSSPFGGQGGNIIVEANNKLNLTVFEDTFITLKQNLDVNVTKNSKINIEQDSHFTCNNMFYKSNLNTDQQVGGDLINTVDGNLHLLCKGTTKLYSTGDMLIKTDASLKMSATVDTNIFTTNAMKLTAGATYDLVSGEYIRGTTGGVVSWNGTPAEPTTAILDPVTTATIPLIPIKATQIDMSTKTSNLSTFSSKFSRNTQLIKTIVGRLMTYEPCPEHMVKASDPKIAKYNWYSKPSLVGKQKAKTYNVGSVSEPNTPAPPTDINAKEDEIIVPVISEKFECGKWVTPETADEGKGKGSMVKINPRELYDGLFKASSERYGVPSCLLSRLAFQESGYNKYAYNVGSKASGLMQIVLRWHPTVKDPFDPNEAIPYAAKYLSDLYRQFGSWDKAMAAYNWGPGSLSGAIKKYGDDWVSHLPEETYNYITKIGNDIGLYS